MVRVKMVEYFSSAVAEVLAKTNFGVWSPIQCLGAQGLRTGPARTSPFVSKFLSRDHHPNVSRDSHETKVCEMSSSSQSFWLGS